MTSPRAPATHRTETAGRHVEEARALYEAAYHGEDFEVEPVDADFSYRYTVTGDDDLTLRSNHFHGALRGIAEIPDEYVSTWITTGSLTLDLDGLPVDLAHGRPVMVARARPLRFEAFDYRQNLVHIRAGYLEAAAAAHEGVAEGLIRFDTTATPIDGPLDRWAGMLTVAGRTAVSRGAPVLLQAEAKHALAVALLDTFPHETVSTPPEVLVPGAARLRRAVDFVHARADLPITIGEIADAAGLSVRGAQGAFQSRLGMAPLQYLRSVRLDRAHAELARSAYGVSSVAEVAGRWGFGHLGRFAGYYLERFGESPNRTLRR